MPNDGSKKLTLQRTTKRGNLMKKLIAISLLLTLVLSLVGCQGGVDMAKADTDTDAFFQAVAAGDFATAQSLMHLRLALPKYIPTPFAIMMQNGIPIPTR